MKQLIKAMILAFVYCIICAFGAPYVAAIPDYTTKLVYFSLLVLSSLPFTVILGKSICEDGHQ